MRRRLPILAPVLIGLLPTIWPARAAHAGCPNLCEISVAPVKAAPALPACASVLTYGDDCDCGLSLTLKNLCDASIRVVDFSFHACVKASASDVRPCSTLEPGFEATALFSFPRANGTGQKPTHLRLQIADIEYMVDVVTNVGEFRSSGCTIGHRAGSDDARAVFGLLAAMLVLRRMARRSWPYSVLLMLVLACSGRPVSPQAAPAGSALERDAVIEGRRLRYSLHLAPQPNLIYHLDCVTGVALCAQVIYRELWSTFAMSGEDEAALVTWKAVRGRLAGELRTVDPPRPPQPLLAPSRVFDLAERQRIVGLRARTPAEYQATIALLATDVDARELRQIVERFAPRFLRWWQARGFAAGSTSFDGFTKLLADPFLDATIQKAAQFYEADLPPGTTFQIHVLVQPASSRKLSVAYQLEGDSVVESPEGEKPQERIEIIAHELFHYFFFRMDPKRQAAMLESVCGSDDPLSVVAFGMLDEAIATALGNGVVGQHYQSPEAFAKRLARGLTRNRATASVAREILPPMSSFLDRGTTVSSDEFLRAFNRATKATFADGRPRPIDYLHSPVLIADGRFASAAQRLRDASQAGFPSLREFASLDAEAKAFLKEHPFISAAILVPDAAGTVLESLGLADGHGAAISSVAARTRGFVYALPRTAKSYAFVFVAGDAKTMDDLVDRFAALAELVPGHEGALVELTR